MSQVLTTASRQWASRRDDERYLTLEELRKSVETRKRESWTTAPENSKMSVELTEGKDDLRLEVYDPTSGYDRQLEFTNWSFAQFCGHADTPAAYMRKLPAPLAAINLQEGLRSRARNDEALILAHSNGDNHIRALTSPSYGRIWDLDVVKGVQQVNADGRWVIPSASYATRNPKRATTLYASDRDVFIFLVDDKNPVEVPGEKEPLFRGFYTWNSEVGAATFGLTTFLYRFVCDNRTIWGATNVQEFGIRHTGGAPERFRREGAQYLRRYSQESTGEIVATVQSAKRLELGKQLKKDQTVEDWMMKYGFTKAQAKASVQQANIEEGQCATLWDAVNGVTAYARSIPHTDERVALEIKAGKMMNLAV